MRAASPRLSAALLCRRRLHRHLYHPLLFPPTPPPPWGHLPLFCLTLQHGGCAPPHSRSRKGPREQEEVAGQPRLLLCVHGKAPGLQQALRLGDAASSAGAAAGAAAAGWRSRGRG